MRSFKSKAAACLAICITAILGIAVCGCDDLGAYENTEAYYASFGDVVLIGGEAEEGKSYSVEKYFYNKESREDFLENSEDKIAHSDYVYVAIPVVDDIEVYNKLNDLFTRLVALSKEKDVLQALKQLYLKKFFG